MKNKHNLLAGKIEEILLAGQVLDRKVMGYIDATFACPSADEFARILSDPDNCEADSAYELLFFPDEEIQVQIEPILEQNSYDDRDVDAVIDLLTRKQLQTGIRFPENRQQITICIPDSAVCRFVARLNITRHIHPTVLAALDRFISNKKERHRIRVALRNARFAYSGEISKFLFEFIKKIYPSPELFKDALPFILDFLDQTGPEAEIYPALMKQKHRCVQMFQQAERIERALKEHSVEALMMKGITVPAINTEETQKKIDIINRVCVLIYKKTDIDKSSDPVAFGASYGRLRL